MTAFAGGMILVLFVVDMAVRQYIEDSFDEQEERETKARKIVLRKVYNRGFLLNTLEDSKDLVRRVSAVTAVGILLYDLWLWLQRGRKFEKVGMIFLTAGAAGNIFDRLIRGKVIDYIGFKSNHSFLSKLTANLADFYVVIGAVLVEIGRFCKKR